jgi:hypothetical protein
VVPVGASGKEAFEGPFEAFQVGREAGGGSVVDGAWGDELTGDRRIPSSFAAASICSK